MRWAALFFPTAASPRPWPAGWWGPELEGKQVLSGFALWPPPHSTVSPATLAREMMALTQASLSPPPFPEDAARGDGQPVIVIPGFLAPDMSTVRLREFLERQNFAPVSWSGGFNLGPMRRVMAGLKIQICELAEKTGRPV